MTDYHPNSKEYRLEQILRYFMSKYPTPYPVKLTFTKESPRDNDEVGSTGKNGRYLCIEINTRLSMYETANSLVHEMAHVLSWSTDRIERREDTPHHPPEWGVKYALLWSDFHDNDGWKESKTF